LTTGGKVLIDHQKLCDFASKVHNLFGLQRQSRELLALVTKTIDCKHACLLFPDINGIDFTATSCTPKSKGNPLSNLRLSRENPVVEYLSQEEKPLTRESLATLPDFVNLREKDAGDIPWKEIELFVPLISRDQLIGILVLGKKQSNTYSLGDFNLLKKITGQVAVSMEKEYLREQLSEREKELSVLNRSLVVMTSSCDIQEIFVSFIKELKKLVDVSWAAVTLIEGSNFYFLALSPKGGLAREMGKRLPIEGTATEWVATHKKTLVESELSPKSQLILAEPYLRQGMRSMACLPLVANDSVIGSLIVASRHPNSYQQRHITLLEQLASQIAMPVENSRLYVEVKERARIDQLTGLLNRRALDEAIASEITRSSRYGGVFSLIMLDLDSFKAFNDNHGHLAGDSLLKEVGTVIRSSVRSIDQAFRYGGDEFSVLLPNTSIDSAKQVAERIRKQLASKVIAGHTPVTASFGLASWPDKGTKANNVIAGADAALYHAKRSGGNQSHYS
jgi:diguanylate cyclase (GGDEF)-like protein